jgi:hypothetical protein
MLPPEFAPLKAGFRSLFSKRIFDRVTTLLVGAVLTVRIRTVAAVLRAVGLAEGTTFSSYHRVLSRARWSAREGARRLLRQLVERFAPEGPVVVGIDECDPSGVGDGRPRHAASTAIRPGLRRGTS